MRIGLSLPRRILCTVQRINQGANGAIRQHPRMAQLAFVAAIFLLKPSEAPLLLPLVFGWCNLQHIIYENLGSIIAGIKGRNTELIQKFDREIEALKKNTAGFINSMVEDLSKEMGLNDWEYELDDHEISHAFEDWLKEANFNDLANPAETARLKELIKGKIGIEAGEDNLDAIIGRHLASGDFNGLVRELEGLREKTDQYLEDNPPPDRPETEEDEDDDFTPQDQSNKGGKASGKV